MAKNERNAGRKPKYANKCKQVGFNLPLDVIDEVKEKVREIVRTKAKRFGDKEHDTNSSIGFMYETENLNSYVDKNKYKEVFDKNVESEKIHLIETKIYSTMKKTIKDLFEKAEFPCGCSIENNLLKRGKGKCKLSKEEHLSKH